MCGITGFTGAKNAELLKRMNETQLHRGPDDQGYYYDEERGVNLAMTRLSIIDISDGHQPMCNADESIWIVFNGEIYNSIELRQNLVKAGYHFKTDHSDTEALIFLYQHYGKEMLSKLNGMFAFVIYDRNNQKLFAARDRFGIKPFYYSISDGRFTFASELKSILKLPWISKEINRQSVYDFFTVQSIPAPGTIFHSVLKLPAATCLEFDLNEKSVKTVRYWKPSFSTMQISDWNLPEIKTRIRNGFYDAVKRWTLSDVEIACSLSGGIDSSAIVAATSQIASYKIKTYTVGYTDAPDMDEKELARKVAEKWDTDHHEIIVQPDDLIRYLDEMIYYLDEPYAGGLPSWFVYKAMSQDVKVAMTGTGGDELFGNYGKWKFYENTQSYIYRVRQFLKYGGKLKHLIKYPNGIHHYPYFNDGFKAQSIFTRESLAGVHPTASVLQNLWTKSNPRDAIPAVDIQLQLPEEFLLMTDRFSMKYSIEARTPFLDNEFSEFIYSLPSSLRTGKEKLKYLFIDSVKDWLPASVIEGPKKGFTLPLDRWLRGKLRERTEALLDKNYLLRQGIFQTDVYEKIAKPFYEHRHNREWELWEFLMFQMWYEKFIQQQESS